MPSFKELIEQHDRARNDAETHPETVELMQAVSTASGQALPKAFMFHTGKFTTLGEFSLLKYTDHILA